MKQITTITLTFKLPHKSGEETSNSIRSLINKLRDYGSFVECDSKTEEVEDG